MQVQQEQKPINIKASIDCKTTARDLQPWDAQTEILRNTGIERDGGITNLFQAIESNVAYEETYFTRTGTRVRLQRDDLNRRFRVFSGEKELGQVPLWGVSKRAAVAADVNDALVTIYGTLLVLKIASELATIEELNIDTLELIRARSFVLDPDVSDGQFVRTKQPTWANVTSIVGIFENSGSILYKIILDSGVEYGAGGMGDLQTTSQVSAYYENGWIVSSNDRADCRTYLYNSAGVLQGTLTNAVYLVQDYNVLTGAVVYRGWRDVKKYSPTLPARYAYLFTPPAAPLGAWTITPVDNTAGAYTVDKDVMTFGGYDIGYNDGGTRLMFYSDHVVTFPLNPTNNSTPPELYGYIGGEAGIAFKVHTIGGGAAYISASFARDGIGQAISEIGEIAPDFCPQVLKLTSGVYWVLYRRGDGSFVSAELSTAVFDRMQEIAPGVVKINCISGVCVVDTNKNDLSMGGNPYNGFIIPVFTSGASQMGYAARHRGEYGGSVDTNFKITSSTTDGGDPEYIFNMEGQSFTYNNDKIDFYTGSVSALMYMVSMQGYQSKSIRTALVGTLYVDDQTIPPPMGADYSDQTIKLSKSTAIRELNYDGYQLLNEVKGLFDSFTLFGGVYLFGGDWIQIASLSQARVVQSVNRVANALGLVFLAESPTSAFFYSSFDNSVYTFDGGQSVAKFLRFNRKGRIYTGAYNVRENTLGLFLDDSILWIRDGIISESLLSFVYPYEIFSTSDGIWIAKDSYAVKYLYNAVAFGPVVPAVSLILDGGIWGTVYPDIIDGGTWGVSYPDMIDGSTWGTGATGTVVPLVWQSKFNGYSDRVRQNIDRMLFRVMKEDLIQSVLSIEYQTYREDGQNTETRDIVIGDAVNPYDPDGYALVEFVPSNRNAIASSIKITCMDKIILLDGYATITTAGDTVAKNRG